MNALHEFSTPPKRKRTSSTSISAADAVFAPEIDLNGEREREGWGELEWHAGNVGQHADASLNKYSDGPFTLHADAAPPAYVDATKFIDAEPPVNEARSPRTAVADKFQNLALRGGKGAAILSFGVKTDEGVERKRVKLEEDEPSSSSTSAKAETSARTWNTATPTSSPPGIPETPSPTHRNLISPRPPTDTTLASLTTLNNSIDHTALTWQDSEITGHLALDPDDDGTGINGIGFKPTPAQMYQRSQRRKQQIMEWRNREARDARQKRAEGRKATSKGLTTSTAAMLAKERRERVVRFA